MGGFFEFPADAGINISGEVEHICAAMQVQYGLPMLQFCRDTSAGGYCNAVQEAIARVSLYSFW